MACRVQTYKLSNAVNAAFEPSPVLSTVVVRGEIDATTFDQMRERLEATTGPQQQ